MTNKNPTPGAKPTNSSQMEQCVGKITGRGDWTAGQKADHTPINKAVKNIAGRKFK